MHRYIINNKYSTTIFHKKKNIIFYIMVTLRNQASIFLLNPLLDTQLGFADLQKLLMKDVCGRQRQ